jgi:hypothetical protein
MYDENVMYNPSYEDLQAQVEELKENLANVSDTRNYYIEQVGELTKERDNLNMRITYLEMDNEGLRSITPPTTAPEPSLLDVAKDYISAAITRNSRFTDDDIKGLINLAQDTIQAVHQAEGMGE